MLGLATCLLLVCEFSLATVHELFPGASIQQAVVQSSPGDTVLLNDGLYTETVVFYGHVVTLASRYLLDGDSFHIARTVIAPDFSRPDTSSCLVYAHGEGYTNRVIGISLTSGLGTRWAANDQLAGGAVYARLAPVSLEHCYIEHSEARYGGGVAFLGLTVYGPQGVLRSCRINDCSTDYIGGGLFAYRCSLLVDDCSFEDNESLLISAAADIMRCSFRVTNCCFRSNFSREGAFGVGEGLGVVMDCEFDGNGCTSEPHRSGFSHFTWSRIQGSVSRCWFHGAPTGHPSIGLGGDPNSPVQFFGNLVEDNDASSFGGTIELQLGTYGEIAYNTFRRNVNVGDAVINSPDNSYVRLHHNVFRDNVSTMPSRASVMVAWHGSQSTLDSNVISGNSGAVITHGFESPTHGIHAERNWWGDPSGPFHPTMNPQGQGDTLLSDSIYFIPWLTSPPDSSMPSAVDDRDAPVLPSTWELTAVYPNPFNHSLRIVVAGFAGSDFRMVLHDMLGREVTMIHRGPVSSGEIMFRADPALASGTYFIQATDRHFTQVKRVVLIR